MPINYILCNNATLVENSALYRTYHDNFNIGYWFNSSYDQLVV
jgi:hypothetical protein